MKRFVLLALSVITAFFLQTSVLSRIAFIPSSPNLILIVVFSYGILRGSRVGLAVGLFVGLILDIYYGRIIGMNALIFMYIGYFNGLMSKIVVTDLIFVPVIFCTLSEAFYHLYIYVFQFLLLKRTNISVYFFQVAFPELLITILATVVIYGVLMFADNKMEEMKKQREAKIV